jgi:hypothetical protein
MAVMPMSIGGHSRWLQLELGRRNNQVESGLALDAYRLQGKWIVSTHEAIRAYADAYCRSGGNAAIYAR